MIAGFSDHSGRRPAYVICFVLYIAANIGLALQNNYAALLILRCFQSAGSSGTVALCQGVVADIATSAERGNYVAYSSVSTVLRPTLSPIIGGLLSQYLGWKAIFWFLAIFAVPVFILLMIFLPETCQNVVGNGTSCSLIKYSPFQPVSGVTRYVLILRHVSSPLKQTF
jgi:multidrug resistance protein